MRTKLKGGLLLMVLVLGLVVSATQAAAQGSIHIERRGETLAQIARRYGTTVNALVQANGLRNANFIWWGQHRRVPGA